MSELVNRVANSSLITLNLEDHYPKQTIYSIDVEPFLFKGLILKEKDFRQSLKEVDWSQYKDGIVTIDCSADAIVPVWAYMLIATYLSGFASTIYKGSKEEFLSAHYQKTIDELDLAQYQDQRIVIKGCSNKPVPEAAYSYLTFKLTSVAKSIMYGEPCSTVPVFKRKK